MSRTSLLAYVKISLTTHIYLLRYGCVVNNINNPFIQACNFFKKFILPQIIFFVSFLVGSVSNPFHSNESGVNPLYEFKVHVESARYHTTPVTLLPVILNLNRWQGTSALFKGIQIIF